MNSEKKITYLPGAGASANELPTIKKNGDKPGLADSMRQVSSVVIGALKGDFEINGDFYSSEFEIANENKVFAKKIVEDLDSYAKKSDEFGTIDTYAKFLYYNKKRGMN